MEFQNRVTNTPGLIKLRDVETGEEKTYQLILADNPTQEGTPITAENLERFKQDILECAVKLGAKGDKGNDGTTITGIKITKVS